MRRQMPVCQVGAEGGQEQAGQEHNDHDARGVEGAEEDGWHEEVCRYGQGSLGLQAMSQ